MQDTYKHKGMRKQLIDELRSRGITDERILTAFDQVPRHFFLDLAFEKQAYSNVAFQIGAGQTTIQAVTSGTTTVLSTGGTAAAPKLRTRYSSATCVKAGTDLWYVIGDLA